MTIDQIIQIAEDHDFTFYEYEENGVVCGYEVSGYTNGGVNMLHFIDCRTNKYTDGLTTENVIEELKEISACFNVDEEIDVHRQDERYRNDFGIRESVNDFEQYEKRLTALVRDVQERSYSDTEKNHEYDIVFFRLGVCRIDARTKDEAEEIARKNIKYDDVTWDDDWDIHNVIMV